MPVDTHIADPPCYKSLVWLVVLSIGICVLSEKGCVPRTDPSPTPVSANRGTPMQFDERA